MMRGLKVVLTIAALRAFSLVAYSQEATDEGAPVNRAQIEAALKLTAEAAEKYSFQLERSADNATLVPDPVLRWSNPAAGEIHGNVFLWTVNGRPAVVGSLYKWFTPHTHRSHEFHSLSLSPLVARYEGEEVWRTREAGLSYLPLEDAPRPAASPPQRLLQMRRLASEFVATKRERDGSQQELRLLSQPIYRYAAAQQQIQDGGLFVFVQGTDPEVFLLLEARGPEGGAAWSLAAARMNGVGFALRRRDQAVWSVEIMPWSDIGSHAETYTTFGFANVTLPETEKAAP